MWAQAVLSLSLRIDSSYFPIKSDLEKPPNDEYPKRNSTAAAYFKTNQTRSVLYRCSLLLEERTWVQKVV